MGFELIIKNLHGASCTIKPMQISVRKNGFSLGSGIADFFAGKTFIEIYVDYENNRIGFKPTDNTITGFKLQEKGGNAKTNTVYLVAKKLVDKMQKGIFYADIENDMVILKVPELATNE